MSLVFCQIRSRLKGGPSPYLFVRLLTTTSYTTLYNHTLCPRKNRFFLKKHVKTDSYGSGKPKNQNDRDLGFNPRSKSIQREKVLRKLFFLMAPDVSLLHELYTVHMYGHTYGKSMDQPGKAASPVRGQLIREN